MNKFVQYIGALFMEKKHDDWAVSIGRVSWWVCIVPALYVWVSSGGEQDIGSGHLTILMTLTAYNFSKHAVGAANNVLGKTKQEPG